MFKVQGFRVSGRVLEHSSGSGLVGAKVYLNDKQVTLTGEGGSYNLENIKTGMYRLTAVSGESILSVQLTLMDRCDCWFDIFYNRRTGFRPVERSHQSNNTVTARHCRLQLQSVRKDRTGRFGCGDPIQTGHFYSDIGQRCFH